MFWLVGLGGLILDQITKFLVVKNFTSVGETFPVWSGVFHFTYVINTGAAFSSFRGGATWLRWLSLAVSAGLMAMAWFGASLSRLEQLAFGFILAGALGNGLDRFLFGYVVDFLDFRVIQFPVFNLADVFINFGIACLLLATFPVKVGNFKGTKETHDRE